MKRKMTMLSLLLIGLVVVGGLPLLQELQFSRAQLVPPETPPVMQPPGSSAVRGLWEATLDHIAVSSPIVADGYIYVTAVDPGGSLTSLNCLNASTGRQVWSESGQFLRFTLMNSYIYVNAGGNMPNESSSISCLNASNGVQVWNETLGNAFLTPLVDEGVVYVVAENVGNYTGDYLYALNGTTGTKIWFSGPLNTNFWSFALGGEYLYGLGSVYRLDSFWGNVFCAFNVSTGEVLWNYTITPGAFSSLTVAGNEVLVSFNFVNNTGSVDLGNSSGLVFDGGVMAFNALNGTEIWDFPINSNIVSLIANDTIYVVAGNGNIYALDALDGNAVWSSSMGVSLSPGYPPLSSPLLVDGYLFVGAPYGVCCFDASNGAVLWRFEASDFAGSSATAPTYKDGVVYVGWDGPTSWAPAIKHNFYGLNASSGEPIWNYTLAYTVMFSPAVSGGVVYVGASAVTTESSLFEGPGIVLALKPNVTSLPLLSPSFSPSPTPSASGSPTSPTSPQTASSSPSPTIPEFPTWMILPLLMISVLAISLCLRRKLKNR